MRPLPIPAALLLAFGFLLNAPDASRAQQPKPADKSALSGADSPLRKYIVSRVSDIERANDRDFEDGSGWLQRAPVLRRELLGMLGLDPLPERGELLPVVTGRLEHEEFTVEKLHFQSLPGLYVTGNLYIPKQRQGKLPGVLYVCGHSVMREGNVSFGNKTGYQHHPAWFARNGFVCLAIDTIQLGEIPGIHAGTRNLGLWWWNSRGYTPAGVETWNGMRALDYLCAREEVDSGRLGVTGRSGGGAYSWYIAAVDERVKAAVPVAGITDLRNHLVDGVIDGHCDCMFFLNTKGWDFAKVAALVAPRPLLIANTDKDPIFPVDGVERIHQRVATVYKALGKADHLGLLITEGGHKDNQELQVPAFRWFKRFLAKTPDYDAPRAEKLFAPPQLRVFDQIPSDERTSSTHEWFIPASLAALKPLDTALRSRVFPRLSSGEARWAVATQFDFSGRTEAVMTLWTGAADCAGAQPALLVSGRTDSVKGLIGCLASPGKPAQGEVVLHVRVGEVAANRVWIDSAPAEDPARHPVEIRCVWMPRGSEMSGPGEFRASAWSASEKESTRIRRRFMLLGETLDSVHVRDLVCMQDTLSRDAQARVKIAASGAQAVNASLAALLAMKPAALDLSGLPSSLADKGAPDHFDLMRVTDLNGILEAVKERVEVRIAP